MVKIVSSNGNLPFYAPLTISDGANLQKKRLAITISVYMVKTYDIKKIGVDKIALLGLFVLSLLIARLIVASKSAIILTEPIKLTQAGLSVSMPEGNGWKSEKKWKYQGNAFSLSSNFTPRPGKPTAWAQCQYLLATETTTPQARFEQMAFDVDGVIIKTERMQIDTLTIDWVHIQKPKTSFSFLFGTAKLSNDHQLDIEVHQIMGDAEMAELTFKRIVKSLNFESRTAEDTIRKFTGRTEYIRRRSSLWGLITNKTLK